MRVMLLDIWEPNKDTFLPASTRFVSANKYRARRFKFTDEVTASIAHLIRDFPNALLDNYQFALPPYPTCYLEFDIELFLDELGAMTTADLMEYRGTIADKTLGYMISDNRINTLVQGTDMGRAVVGGITYSYVEHRPLPGYSPLKGASEDAMLALLLGSTLQNNRSSLTEERVHDLILRVRPHFETTVMVRKDSGKVMQSLFMGAIGEARNFMSLLLWLNQPKVMHIADVPAGRGWFKGKPRAYAAHHIVRLKPEVTYRSIVKAFAPRRAPRRHEVSAFWRNFDKTTGCEHDWPVLPDENGHWHCRKCPQWRTRVRNHERGDAGIGFVTKEYKA